MRKPPVSEGLWLGSKFSFRTAKASWLLHKSASDYRGRRYHRTTKTAWGVGWGPPATALCFPTANAQPPFRWNCLLGRILSFRGCTGHGHLLPEEGKQKCSLDPEFPNLKLSFQKLTFSFSFSSRLVRINYLHSSVKASTAVAGATIKICRHSNFDSSYCLHDTATTRPSSPSLVRVHSNGTARFPSLDKI